MGDLQGCGSKEKKRAEGSLDLGSVEGRHKVRRRLSAPSLWVLLLQYTVGMNAL